MIAIARRPPLAPLGRHGIWRHRRADVTDILDGVARTFGLIQSEEGKRLPRLRMRSWAFVVVAGLVLALLAILDRGGLAVANGPCEFSVNTPTLNVRAGPSAAAAEVSQLSQGTQVPATNVLTAGFRKLSDGRWALDSYLTPVSGSVCG
jgi:hypothetical protein